MIESLRQALTRGRPGKFRECRRCGTTIERANGECPSCGSTDIVRYDL